MGKNLNLGLAIKIFTDAITLSSLNEPEGRRFYESNKKKIQRMENLDVCNLKEKDLKHCTEYFKKLNDWMVWARENEYLQVYQQNALTDFFELLFKAAMLNIPLNKNMSEHIFAYVLAKVLYKQIEDYIKGHSDKGKYEAIYNTLSNFHFFGNDFKKLQKDFTPIGSSFSLLTDLVKDKNEVIKYWEKIIDNKGEWDAPLNLKLYIERWIKGVTPTWKNLKLFYDKNMCIPEFFFINDEDIKENGYRTFKANLYMAFVLTNVFDSLEKLDILSKESRIMIRNGSRLYYRDFFIVRDKNHKEYSPTFEPEAKNNLMFRTLFCMLDGTLNETPLEEYIKSVDFYPETPVLL